LREVLAAANVTPADVLSKRSKVYQVRRDEIDAMDDEALLEAMVAEPTLIRRPLIVAGEMSITGFDRKGLAQLAEQHGKSE
jgi:arsenate reductase-like glutaredoxin family protein